MEENTTFSNFSIVDHNSYNYAILDAVENDHFIIHGASGNSPRLWRFFDYDENTN
jgi:hypothetical protein